MKSKRLAIALAVLAFVLPIQGQKPPALPSDQGRYQLLAIPLGERGATSQLFLFDSQTGRVWHFRPESTIENGPGKVPTLIPEAFIPVTIWSPNGQKVLPDGN
jgi:hypothetical protein